MTRAYYKKFIPFMSECLNTQLTYPEAVYLLDEVIKLPRLEGYTNKDGRPSVVYNFEKLEVMMGHGPTLGKCTEALKQMRNKYREEKPPTQE